MEDEIGAGCSVVREGKTVVDIWGGWRNGAMDDSWDEFSTVCMMSVAKGITAICFNMLMDRGLVHPDDPVIKYWPEYGQNGKESTLIKHFLDSADDALAVCYRFRSDQMPCFCSAAAEGLEGEGQDRRVRTIWLRLCRCRLQRP